MILIPLPEKDFEPTEASLPWKRLQEAGREIVFATPQGKQAVADFRSLTGRGLGPWRPLLMAGSEGRAVYAEMEKDPGFKNPISYKEMNASQFDGILLPGGHAPGMRQYLESELLQDLAAEFFALDKPVGAICHGVQILARAASRSDSSHSPLFGRRTTTLPFWMEASAYMLTGLWLGNYFRTYNRSVQSEVVGALKNQSDFDPGPYSLARDSYENPLRGFCLTDGNYVSARWPGDASCFGYKFLELLNKGTKK